MKAEKTFGRFGYKIMGGADEPYPTNAIVQIQGCGPSVVAIISEHLMCAQEVDRFIAAAHADLDKVAKHAKAALAKANGQRV